MLEKDRKAVIHTISEIIASNLEVMPAERRPAYLGLILDRLANYELSTLLFALRMAHPNLPERDTICYVCGEGPADRTCEYCGMAFCEKHFHAENACCSDCRWRD